MVSEHGIEIEIRGDSPVSLDPLSVVVEVLAFDSDIWVAHEQAHGANYGEFLFSTPVAVKRSTASGSHKRNDERSCSAIIRSVGKGNAGNVAMIRLDVTRQAEQISACSVTEPVAE